MDFGVLREVVAAMRSSRIKIRWPLCWSYVAFRGPKIRRARPTIRQQRRAVPHHASFQTAFEILYHYKLINFARDRERNRRGADLSIAIHRVSIFKGPTSFPARGRRRASKPIQDGTSSACRQKCRQDELFPQRAYVVPNMSQPNQCTLMSRPLTTIRSRSAALRSRRRQEPAPRDRPSPRRDPHRLYAVHCL